MLDQTKYSQLVRPDGLVSRRIFVDPDVYKEELDKVFGRCWLFVGHVGQVPAKGDYFTNYMGEDPVIVTRGSDDKIHVLLNSCRHRGMKVCRTDCGNATEFQCPFHGWTYANTGELQGVPFYRDAYKSALDKREWGLRQAPKVQVYGGLIFACWDSDAPPLEEYLGDVRFYLDTVLERQIGGYEFIPGQQRYKLNANWKIASENFAGDSYHLHHSHATMFDLDIRQINPTNPISYRKQPLPNRKMPEYHNVCFGNGHGLNGLLLTGERLEMDRKMAKEMGPEVVEYVDELHNRMSKRLSPEQVSMWGLAFSNVFPNFSFTDFSALRPFGLYLWHPRGPGMLEAWQWCAVDSAAPKAVKDLCRIDFPRTQAVTGVAAQDDTENFEQVTEATRGLVSQRLDFNYQMDVENENAKTVDGYPGIFAANISETNQRAFYAYWAELMNEPSKDGKC